jgi:alkylmercury lyase
VTERSGCSDAAFFQSFDGVELIPVIIRLIARGRPVPVDQIATESGSPVGEVERILRRAAGTDWDDDGRLVGLGLTLRPTAHRFTIGGRRLYTWCATDPLLFASILDLPALVESTCPATGQAIRIELDPPTLGRVDPPDTVVSQRQYGEVTADFRSEICDHGHFFASPAAGAAWLADHPDGELLSVAVAFERGRATCGQLGWSRESMPR